MEGKEESSSTNWSEKVEDLVHGGNLDEAISLLESVISKLESSSNSPQSDLQISSALFDLAQLYSAKGLSLKSDEIESRAHLIRHRSNHSPSPSPQNELNNLKELDENWVSTGEVATSNGSAEDGYLGKSSKLPDHGLPGEGSSDDDWEAIADRDPDELLSPQSLPSVSKLSLEEDTKAQTPKRRGRGTFSYKKHGLYSDHQSDGPISDKSEDEIFNPNSESAEIRELKYGTRHVLVLADFPPSTKTTDLERLLENFKDRGFVIRWVNDTVALAVFRTPSIALEACNCIKCPFTVHILDENDGLLSSISPRDLEPPRQRPETSARTAKRLIANVMGLKLPSSEGFDLRKQEEARRNRIISRQNMKDDAWGDD
ncbi:hypothetical protein LguiA_021410 [Lonicera macranthoides]